MQNVWLHFSIILKQIKLTIMKTLNIFSIVLACCVLATASYAQKNISETIKVSGNCGMCKKKIETAAKSAGASSAEWNVGSKVLTVKYNSKTTNNAKIQEAVAKSGYDTESVTATDEAYNNLHGCCKYERVNAANAMPDCCKDGKCTQEGHDGKDCCKKDGMAKNDCCKDGSKCSKEGKAGKDCCKKDKTGKHGH
jgi:mercuric ion binding protein